MNEDMKENETLRREVAALDNADDGDWNKDGLPDCNVLKERCGFAVTRKMLKSVVPGACRRSSPVQASLAECNAMAARHAKDRAKDASNEA